MLKKFIIPFILVTSLVVAGCGQSEAPAKSEEKTAHITQTKTKEEGSKEKSEVKEEPTPEPTEEPTKEPTKAPEKESSEGSADVEMREGPNSTDELAIYNYVVEGGYGSGDYVTLVGNKTNKTIDVDGTLEICDKDGKVIDTTYDYVFTLAPGAIQVMDYYLSDFDSSNTYKESFKISDSFSESFLSVDCDYGIWAYEENAVVGLYNGSDKSFEFPSCKVLFFDDKDNVVSIGYGFFGDADGNVKPGDTAYASVSAYEEYDHAEAYFCGDVREKTEDYVDVEKLNVEEIVATDGIFDSRAYIVENTTDKDIIVGVTVVAADADDNPLDAASETSSVIPAGEKGVLLVDLYNVEPGDVENYYYILSAGEPYANSIVKDIEYTAEKADDKVVVKAKNNSSKDSYVWGYVLFFDKDGNFIDYDLSSFAADGDDKLYAGKEGTAEFSLYGGSFDSYQIFLEADVY